jgi:hypothetical protein
LPARDTRLKSGIIPIPRAVDDFRLPIDHRLDAQGAKRNHIEAAQRIEASLPGASE